MSSEKVFKKLEELRKEYDEIEDKMFPLLDRCPNWDQDDEECDNFDGHTLTSEELTLCQSLLDRWRYIDSLLCDPQCIPELSKKDINAYLEEKEEIRKNELNKIHKNVVMDYLEEYDKPNSEKNKLVMIQCTGKLFYETLDEWLKSRVQRLY